MRRRTASLRRATTSTLGAGPDLKGGSFQRFVISEFTAHEAPPIASSAATVATPARMRRSRRMGKFIASSGQVREVDRTREKKRESAQAVTPHLVEQRGALHTERAGGLGAGAAVLIECRSDAAALGMLQLLRKRGGDEVVRDLGVSHANPASVCRRVSK